MGAKCCGKAIPRWKHKIHNIFSSYKPQNYMQDDNKQEQSSDQNRQNAYEDPDNNKRKSMRKSKAKQIQSSIAKLARIEKFVQLEGKKQLVFYLKNSSNHINDIARYLYVTIMDKFSRLTHKLIAFVLIREMMSEKLIPESDVTFKEKAQSYIVSLVDKYHQSRKFSLKLAALKLLRDLIPLINSKIIPGTYEKIISEGLGQKQEGNQLLINKLLLEIQKLNYQIFLYGSRMISSIYFESTQNQMMKSILHLLSQVIWPMQMKSKLLANQAGFYFSQSSRKRSESVGSKIGNLVPPLPKDAGGSNLQIDQVNKKTKRKVEILDVFFQSLSNISHHIDNHYKDCQFFINQLFKYFDAQLWQIAPLISHILQNIVFYQPNEDMMNYSHASFMEHGNNSNDHGIINHEHEPYIQITNNSLLQQCQGHLSQILIEDNQQFMRQIHDHQIQNEFILRHLSKIQFYFEIDCNHKYNNFLSNENKNVLTSLTGSYIMVAIYEGRKQLTQMQRKFPHKVNDRNQINEIGNDKKMEDQYFYVINLSKVLISRVNDSNICVEMFTHCLNSIVQSMETMGREIQQYIGILTKLLDQYVNRLGDLITKASKYTVLYVNENLDLILHAWQSIDILDPLFKLGVGSSGHAQIYNVIGKYLRIIEFRAINARLPSKQKQQFSLLYVITLLESQIQQRTTQIEGRKNSNPYSQNRQKQQNIHTFTHAISVIHQIFSSCIDQKNQAEIILAFLKSLNDMRLQQNLKMPIRCFFATIMAFILFNIKSYIKKNKEEFIQYREKCFLKNLSAIKQDNLRKPIYTLVQQIENSPNIGAFPFRYTQQYLKMIWETVNEISQIKTKASALFERDFLKLSKFQNILLNCISSHANNDDKQRFLQFSFHEIVLREFQMEREVTLHSVAEVYYKRHQNEKMQVMRSMKLVASEQFKNMEDVGRKGKQFNDRYNLQVEEDQSEPSIFATSRSSISTKDPMKKKGIQTFFPTD